MNESSNKRISAMINYLFVSLLE